MGSSSSKFRKHLQNGDEYAALQLYNSNGDLRKGLDPNLSYGDTYSHDTPLHFAARHSLKSLLRIFLYEHGGNPNKRNSENETSLHCVCQCINSRNLVIQQRRADCLAMILQWRGATHRDGEIEKVDLAAQDEKKNTALHYAAASGLKRCVELLVSQAAPLFPENAQRQTPCDCAEANGHGDIARYLESKMVFSNEDDNTDDLDSMLDQMETDPGYHGLRAQDLQEAKDQLLVETADMLQVPLFTAEALLRNHEWSREMLLEAWMEDSVACCDKCGVLPPASVATHDHYSMAPSPLASSSSTTLQQPAATQQAHTASAAADMAPVIDDSLICDICTCELESSVTMLCDHQFCRGCWETYLTGKIQEGDAHNITCPGYQCSKLVPVELIETLVSRDMARRYLQFDIKAFVESNPSIKWCPYPGCGRAVKLPEAADNPLSPRGMNDSSPQDYSHAVDCGNGHTFCWECLGEAHEPVSCPNWKLWQLKTGELNPETLGDTEEETEMAANCLWLVTNSKPCPNCTSPIQKNEGCNHMKCSKCKYDFCWVCQEQWKKHSSATGGYFRCNRYEVLKKVDENTKLAKAEAEARNKRMQELNRFVHYYSRFKNHEHSYKLEEPLSSTAKEKMLVLAKAITDQDSANLETKFVEDAVHQLLKARRVLKCSYAYGFYLEDTGYKKPIFEFMQTELEECTETLSEMIARPYLRTPRSKIIHTAHLVQRKRHEFVTAISKGLVPPDSSPNSRRRKKQYNVELDDDLKKALMASIQDATPSNPWVKDPSGKHANVSLLLDWPEEDDDDDDDDDDAAGGGGFVQRVGQQRGGSQHSSRGVTSTAAAATAQRQEPGASIESSVDMSAMDALDPSDSTTFIEEVCAREGCYKQCVQNPRTGTQHQHCSMRCLRAAREAVPGAAPPAPTELTDYHLDLLRALEMSRMQFIRDIGQLHSGERSPQTPPRSPRSPQVPQYSSGRNTNVLLPPTSASSQLQPPSHHPPTCCAEHGGRLAGDLGGLVLADPPKGRMRIHSEPVGGGGGRSSHPQDVEFQRALELSRISLNDEERDLRMAIELSLADSTTSPHPELPPPPPPPPATASAAALSSEYSTIVTRVPNKSVEDLAIPPPPVVSAPFGLVKDLHVSNILSADDDKTKDFMDKDFSQVFVKYASPTDMNAVFEPRPPQSPYSPRAPVLPESELPPYSLSADLGGSLHSGGASNIAPPPPVAVSLGADNHPGDPWRPRAPVDDMPHVDSRMLESLLHGVTERFSGEEEEEEDIEEGREVGAGINQGAESDDAAAAAERIVLLDHATENSDDDRNNTLIPSSAAAASGGEGGRLYINRAEDEEEDKDDREEDAVFV